MLLSAASAHFILSRVHGWKFDKRNDFACEGVRRLFPTQNRKPGPRLNTNWFMTPPFSTTTQPSIQTNL